jgi:hypothetical protein
LQENIQSVLIEQNENNNNKIVSNYNILGEKNNPFLNFKMKNDSPSSNEIKFPYLDDIKMKKKKTDYLVKLLFLYFPYQNYHKN